MELYRQAESKYWTADFIVNGRRYRKSTKQTTRAKAGEVAAEFLRQTQRNEVPVRRGQTPTLRQFVEKHFLPLNNANARTKLKTKEYYHNGWCRLEHQPIVDMRMDQIRTPHIETIHAAGSPSTHNCALRTLRRIFHIAVDLDVIPKVPKFSLLAENQRTQLITPEIEFKIAAQFAASTRKGSLNTALYIILDCGLRPIEIVNLKIADVDLKLGGIRVNRSKSKAGERLVPMTDRVKKLLYAQIGKRSGGWLFPSPRYAGQPIKRHALTAAWRMKATKAGVSPDVDLYCARHTYGTDIMNATKDPFMTMRLMGHTELSTTKRYQHPSMAHIGELMDARNDLRHSSCHSDHLVQ